MKKPVQVLVVLLALGTLAVAQNRPVAGRSIPNHKVSQDLQIADSDETVNVIVQFRQAPTERHHLAVQARGGRLRTDLHAIRASVYSIPASRLAELADDPDVEYISPDRPVAGAMDLAGAATYASMASLYGVDGTGVTVAVIDSGIMDSHPDLQ